MASGLVRPFASRGGCVGVERKGKEEDDGLGLGTEGLDGVDTHREESRCKGSDELVQHHSVQGCEWIRPDAPRNTSSMSTLTASRPVFTATPPPPPPPSFTSAGSTISQAPPGDNLEPTTPFPTAFPPLTGIPPAGDAAPSVYVLADVRPGR